MKTCPNCGYSFPDNRKIIRCPKCCYTKELMDYKEFAELLGVSVKTVQRLEKTGRLKAIRFDYRHIRIHKSEYDRLIGITKDNMPASE